MKTDDWKLLASYGLAWVVTIGGGLMLFVSRLEESSDFALVVAGFVGAAITFVFNRESATQATRAAQSSAAQATANQQP